jgi:hypothetical protein
VRIYLEVSEKLQRDKSLRQQLRQISIHSRHLLKCVESLPLNVFDATRLALSTNPIGEAVIVQPPGWQVKPLELPPKGLLVADLKRLDRAASRALCLGTEGIAWRARWRMSLRSFTRDSLAKEPARVSTPTPSSAANLSSSSRRFSWSLALRIMLNDKLGETPVERN